MPFDHDQIQNLDAVIDGLDTPTSLEMWQATDPYDAGMVAASAVRRALSGGDGGAAWSAAIIASADSPYTASASDLIFAGDDDGGITINLPAAPAAGSQVAIVLPVTPDEGVVVTTTDGSMIGLLTSLDLRSEFQTTILVFDGENWEVLSAEPAVPHGTDLTLGDVTVTGQLVPQGILWILGPFFPDILDTVSDVTIDANAEPVYIATTSGITITLPQLSRAVQDQSFWIKNASDDEITVSTAVAAEAISAGAPSLPLTVVEGVNDTFVYTPIATGVPETFTVAPGTYATGADLANAIAGAIGSTSSEEFLTYASCKFTINNLLVLTSVNIGTSSNGDTLTAGDTDVLADLAFSDPATFANGGYSGLDGDDTLTLPAKAGIFVMWDGSDPSVAGWCLMLSHGL